MPLFDLERQFGQTTSTVRSAASGRLRPGMRVSMRVRRRAQICVSLQAGFDVFATDATRKPWCCPAARCTSGAQLPPENSDGAVEQCRSRTISRTSCSERVLHFARDTAQFDAMVGEMWRVLSGRHAVLRLASTSAWKIA